MDNIKGKRSICRNEDSLWLATTASTDYPSLSLNTKTDVDTAVIGGGIAGISTALFLKQAGTNVALIEADRVAKGVSGYTSGKITSQHILIYRYLIDKFGFDMAKQYADANQAAIEKIAGIIKIGNVECDFLKKTAYTYAETDETLEKLIDETEAARSLGLPAYHNKKVPIPIPSKGAVCFSGQAQFHPRKYLLKLAEMIPGNGSMVFEKTRATDIKEYGRKGFLISTVAGEVTARNVVIATNFPFYDKPGQYYARMEAGRIYSFAMKLKTGFPDGIFISAEKNIYSFRSQPYQNSELIIAGGQEHVTGKVEDTTERYVKLFKYVSKYYDVDHIEFCWSSQDNNTIDMVPYIGRYLPNGKNIFIATGFNGWGMTHGTIAAMIITDLIHGVKNPWSGIYDPARFKLNANNNIAAAKKMIKKAKLGRIVQADRPGVFEDFDIQENIEKTVAADGPKKSSTTAGTGKTDISAVFAETDVKSVTGKPGIPAQADKTDQYYKIKEIRNFYEYQKDISPGNGKIIKISGTRVALYKHDNGDLYFLKPLCPHMGCLLIFNDAEKSWDCPCHGSRFSYDGKVLNSPAFEDLEILSLNKNGEQNF
jgi:glycine/D-amino acid oxidase-like deaminating enzyme/nitrite reductase/ring-hydroxylating ferredoxin subunit